MVIYPKKYKHKIDRNVAIILQSFALLRGNGRQNLIAMDFNWFTFDRKVASDIEVIRVKDGVSRNQNRRREVQDDELCNSGTDEEWVRLKETIL